LENPIEDSAAIAAPPTYEPPVHRLRFCGDGASLFLLILKNLFLTVITLGIYAPWARAERRRYIWGSTEIAGQRLVFTGTGLELFKGYLKVLVVYVAFAAIPPIVNRFVPGSQIYVQVLLALALVGLIPFAVYWSRGYLLSRTKWRGIQFGLRPGAAPYAKVFLGGYLLTLLTLGIYAPVWLNRLRAILLERTRFGTEAFSYDGSNKDAFRIGIKGFVLSLLTLGFYYFWYAAEMNRFVMSHTSFMAARGRSELTGKDMLVIVGGSILGTALTLGLAFPWIAVWSTRRLLERITFVGEVDFALVLQRASAGNAASDALAHDLGVDLAI
jgi:uncharacterized membrane protein YjgN (DUF898 family)